MSNRFAEIGQRFALPKEAEREIQASIAETILARTRKAITRSRPVNAIDWAVENRVLVNSAESRYQAWRVPHFREIADRLASGSKKYRQITIQKSAQCGLSELLTNEMLRRQDTDPCVCLCLLPTEALAKKLMAEKLDSALRYAPFSSMKIRSRDMTRGFGAGGTIIYGSAAAPTNLSSVAAKLVIGDEASQFPIDIGGQGSFEAMASARGITFADARVVMCSTPISEEVGYGTFQTALEAGDERHYLCECVGCKKHFEWLLETMQQIGDDIVQVCPHCKTPTHEGEERRTALRNGYWKAYNENPERGCTSYVIGGMLAEWEGYHWRDIYDAHQKVLSGKSPMKPFYNLKLGLPYDVLSQDMPSPHEAVAYFRTQDKYLSGYIPKGAVFLCASIDIQKNWSAFGLFAFGPNMECWLIKRERWEHPNDAAALRARIDDALTKEYYTQGVQLPLHSIAVDSRYCTSQVHSITECYPSAMRQTGGWHLPEGSVISVMGSTTQRTDSEIVGWPDDVRQRGRKKIFFTIGAELIKRQAFGALSLQIAEARENRNKPDKKRQKIYLRLHMPSDLPESEVQELVNEVPRKERDKHGREKTYYVLPGGKQNETLDLLIMSVAQVHIMKGATFLAWKAENMKDMTKKPRPEGTPPTQEEIDAIMRYGDRQAAAARRQDERRANANRTGRQSGVNWGDVPSYVQPGRNGIGFLP